MDKVFIVTDGDYSRYHIVGVFSTKEAAEVLRKAIGGHSAEFEEWTIDECLGHEIGPVFRAEILKADGTVVGWQSSPRSLRLPKSCLISEGDKSIYADSPISSEHAKKVAIECRQEWLRAGGLPEEGSRSARDLPG